MSLIHRYTPGRPNLHLSPLAIRYPVRGASPFFHHLTNDDIHATTINERTSYCITQPLGVAITCAIDLLAKEIVRAALAKSLQLAITPSPIPFNHYIPDHFFAQLGLPRPAILGALESRCFNVIYAYGSIEQIVAYWEEFQNIGLETIAWINTARERSDLLGEDSFWDWDYRIGQIILPTSNINHPLITDIIDPRLVHGASHGPVPGIAASAITASDDDYIMGNSSTLSADDDSYDFTQALVLHPLESEYIRSHPHYDVFSGEPIIIDDDHYDA
ncbi:hypothetical protein BDN70DRAFT_939448 [Pholiota conissans]|uniref:Uncharacterized protein n=1 Tax=Pholiota conissans TaxID=109636 RepID=A0A9P6CLK2_9AGAR|nr:hypothetical protein BDN70DRAFT_939448 [Pholiota conissans]